jgi:hypothetical protein
MQIQKQLSQVKFIRNMLRRGLTPVANRGGGNCVFISLAQIVLGDSAKFEFMRYMIVHRLNKFPQKYKSRKNNLSDYCDGMIVNGNPAGALELQVIADICFSVVECYSTDCFYKPVHTIHPLRTDQIPECKGLIRLWVQGDHCMALVDRSKRHLIQNIADDSDILEAFSYSAQ